MLLHSCRYFSLIALLSAPLIGPVSGQEAVAGAEAETDKATEADSEKTAFEVKQILGTWNYVSGQRNGSELSEEHFAGQEVVITKESITLKSAQLVFEISYEFVEETKPQAIKMTITKSPFGAGQKTNGIIELKDAQLKLCYPPLGGDAPKKFGGDEGSLLHCFVLKREAKQE